MDFKQTIEQIFKMCDEYAIGEFLYHFKATFIGEQSGYEELENFYNDHRHDFMNDAIDFCVSEDRLFNKLLLTDRDFLKVYNPQVRDLVEHIIFISNKENRFDTYFNWEEKKFEPEDFTLEDMLTFVNILKYPPLPLISKGIIEEDLKVDKEQMLIKLTNENSYKFLEAGGILCNAVINGDIKGNFRIWTSEGLEYYIHSSFVEVYEHFANIIKYNNELSLNIQCKNKNVIEALIKFFYGQRFYITDEEVMELLELADYYCLNSLIQICSLILDDTDFEQIYKNNKMIHSTNRFFYNNFSTLTDEKVIECESLIIDSINKGNLNNIPNFLRSLIEELGEHGFSSDFKRSILNHLPDTSKDDYIIEAVVKYEKY